MSKTLTVRIISDSIYLALSDVVSGDETYDRMKDINPKVIRLSFPVDTASMVKGSL